MKKKYFSPTCELRSVNGRQLLCASERMVTIDDFVINENENDW